MACTSEEAWTERIVIDDLYRFSTAEDCQIYAGEVMNEAFSVRAARLKPLTLFGQVLLTAAVLAWVPGNAAKLSVMLVVWAIGFSRITFAECILMICVNAIFVTMDIATIHQGSFRFTAPDFLGLPLYEFLMWGFYVLNAIRALGTKLPQRGSVVMAAALAVLFALPFSLVHDYGMLFLCSAVVLAIVLGIFHERRDLAFVCYLVVMGAVIEYAGVKSGQWVYHGSTLGGVPGWFATMWGGVGVFTHRLWLPLLRSLGQIGKDASVGGKWNK